MQNILMARHENRAKVDAMVGSSGLARLLMASKTKAMAPITLGIWRSGRKLRPNVRPIGSTFTSPLPAYNKGLFVIVPKEAG